MSKPSIAIVQRPQRFVIVDGVPRIAISALTDNRPSIHAIEKVGFRDAGSLFLSRRLGAAPTWWAEAPA